MLRAHRYSSRGLSPASETSFFLGSFKLFTLCYTLGKGLCSYPGCTDYRLQANFICRMLTVVQHYFIAQLPKSWPFGGKAKECMMR